LWSERTRHHTGRVFQFLEAVSIGAFPAAGDSIAVGWSCSWAGVGALDFRTSFRIDAPRVTAAGTALKGFEFSVSIASWVLATDDIHHGSFSVEFSQFEQTFSASWATTNITAFDFGSGFWVNAETESGRAVSLDDFEVTENCALGAESSGHWWALAQSLFVIGLGAWSRETAFDASSAVDGFGSESADFGTFDLFASLGINAPRVSGAAAALNGFEETVVIAFGVGAANLASL